VAGIRCKIFFVVVIGSRGYDYLENQRAEGFLLRFQTGGIRKHICVSLLWKENKMCTGNLSRENLPLFWIGIILLQ